MPLMAFFESKLGQHSRGRGVRLSEPVLLFQRVKMWSKDHCEWCKYPSSTVLCAASNIEARFAQRNHSASEWLGGPN